MISLKISVIQVEWYTGGIGRRPIRPSYDFSNKHKTQPFFNVLYTVYTDQNINIITQKVFKRRLLIPQLNGPLSSCESLLNFEDIYFRDPENTSYLNSKKIELPPLPYGRF